MANTDIAYCNGKGCILRSQCRRYLNGQRIIVNQNGDANQYRWMDNCDPETREGYFAMNS
jgi:hypothetical protein